MYAEIVSFVFFLKPRIKPTKEAVSGCKIACEAPKGVEEVEAVGRVEGCGCQRCSGSKSRARVPGCRGRVAILEGSKDGEGWREDGPTVGGTDGSGAAVVEREHESGARRAASGSVNHSGVSTACGLWAIGNHSTSSHLQTLATVAYQSWHALPSARRSHWMGTRDGRSGGGGHSLPGKSPGF